MKRIIILVALLTLPALPALAQDTYRANRFAFSATGCQITSGASSPEGNVTAPACSVYLRTDGTVWRKASGSGNTGWVQGQDGTVTSVGLSMPGIFSVSGSPVTTTGTFAVSLATQSANTIWAGPTTGSAAAPTFRTMVLADIPDGLITDAKVNASAAIGWTKISKAGSSLADLETRSASSLNSGTLADARLEATIDVTTALNSPQVTATLLAASNVNSDLVPDATDTRSLGNAARLWKNSWISTMNALVFAKTTQTLFGGYSTIGYNAGTLAANVAAGATQIDFGTTMTPGHFVLIRAHDTAGAIKAEYLQVGSNVSGTTYNVTRDLAAAHGTDPAWAAGTPFLVNGTTGTGRIDLIAVDGKPRIVFTQQGSSYNTQTDHVVLGNLSGYFGYVSDTWGAAFGVPSGAWVKIDPTNGVRLGYDASTLVAITGAGASFTGSVTVTGGNAATTSYVDTAEADAISTAASDATSKANAAQSAAEAASLSKAVYLSPATSTINGATFTDGTITAAKLAVTALSAITANLGTVTAGTITGVSITTTTGAIGGWTLGSSTLTGGNMTLANSGNLTAGTSNDVVRLSADDATYRLWIGHATAASAPFRVTKAGSFTATDATITGTITTAALTATGGTVGGWTLGSSTLTGGNMTLANSGNLTAGTSNNVVRLSADDATYRLWIGHATAASAPFRVTYAGAVAMSNATVSAGGALTFESNTDPYTTSAQLQFARNSLWGRPLLFALENNGGSQNLFIDNKLTYGSGSSNGETAIHIFTDGWVAGVGAYGSAGLSLLSGPGNGSRAQLTNANYGIMVTSDGVLPFASSGTPFGKSDWRWSAVYADAYYSGTTPGVTRSCNMTSGAVPVSDGLVTDCVLYSEEEHQAALMKLLQPILDDYVASLWRELAAIREELSRMKGRNR